MKLSFKHLLPLVAAIAFTTSTARAGLLGDKIFIEATTIDPANPANGEAIVSNGVEFNFTNNFENFLLDGEFIDFDDTSVSLFFTGPVQFTFTVSDIVGVLNGVTSNSGTISNITFNTNSFSFLFISKDGADTSSGLVNLSFRPEPENPNNPVPEPTNFAALAGGLGVIAYIRRRR